MQYQKISLPIDEYLDEILVKVLESSTILIKASPGSGKTTRLPWFIAEKTQSKVAVLEPRRLAAKLAAERISQEEGFVCGQEVGYHFRFEKKTSSKTNLTFYTEGTFLKKITSDKDLIDIDIVILDEFHDRHLDTDMALAFLLGLQKKRKLKIILMSATLDTDLNKYLHNPAVIEIAAPRFPIELVYLANQPSILNQNLEQKIRTALEKIPSLDDVLIFLPGMREIQKVQNYLGENYGRVFILHSETPKEEQDKALGECSSRKIILSTNLAESSITIPGIKAVIDSGIQREAHYSPWNGLRLILDRPVTKASAIQRAARAGRTDAGVCHRLYSLQDFESRENFTEPEILKADLTDTYLLSRELPLALEWITPPPADRWDKARQLCYLMGLIDEKNNITPLATKTSKYPVDLRLSRVLIAGEEFNQVHKKELLNYVCHELENDQSGILYRRLGNYLEVAGSKDQSFEKAMLAGFIDQVAFYRIKQHDFIHFSGKTIKLHHSLGTLIEGYYLILNITQRQEAISILPIEEEWLFEHEPFPFTTDDQFEIESQFSIKSLTKLGSIVIDEKSMILDWKKLNPDQKAKVITIASRTFNKRWESWKETDHYNRFNLWAKLSAKNLETVETCLSVENYFKTTPSLNWNHLEEYFLQEVNNYLDNPLLDRDLPFAIQVSGKKELKVHYPFNSDPYIEAPIHEFYGLKETPKIAQNKIVLTLKLLGPHKMPIQVTKDLQGFWQKTYLEMKKELQREYPRHHWPENPATAPAILLKRQLPV